MRSLITVLVIFLNVPALVTIILCYVWFGLVESAAILAVVVNKLPNVIVTIREGTRTLDRDLLEMARCYHFSRRKTLVHVIWPQLHPFVMGATRSGSGIDLENNPGGRVIRTQQRHGLPTAFILSTV